MDVVRALGAVQAQDYAGAKWALAMRMGGVTQSVIDRDVDEGRILRTHVLRPTWHFVAPEDIRWMLALTGPRVAGTMASYNRKLELTPAVFRRTRAVIENALRDGNCLTRLELQERLERGKLGPMRTQRLAHVMMQAELDGVVCSGPRRGKQFTYALLDERAPRAAPMDRDEALGTLARRYFATRSPASTRDLSWWSGLKATDARRAIEIVGRDLEPVTVKDETQWLWSAFASPRATRCAHLLPNYDEYFIGFRDRSAAGQRVGSTAMVTGGDALVLHIVAVDGQIVGGWKRVAGRGETIVQGTMLDAITQAERRRLDAAARMLADHLGQPVRVELRSRSTGPHSGWRSLRYT